MRLTRKEGKRYSINKSGIIFENEDFSPLVTKLGQLEDIEEELGIDLLTLFKAIKNGIWFKKGKKRIVKDEPDGLTKCALENGFQYIKRDGWRLDCINGLIETKDYGKTWALTKEELL